MGRNIKSYQGAFQATTGARYGNASTGYTVPSGKVARIGFNVHAQGGTSNYSAAEDKSVAGFYAGTSAGTSSTGSNTNRILLAHSHGTRSNIIQGLSMNLNYNAATGTHKWSAPMGEYAAPRLFIGDNHRERYTSRSAQEWYRYNFYSTSHTSAWGALAWEQGNNQNFQYQVHNFAYMHTGANNATYGAADENFRNGPAHAFAGETIYIFDYCPHGYTNSNYRTWRKCQWQLFVIEEDA